MTTSSQAMHALIERSPACVAAHDRQGWIGLFSDDAIVEDPVGTAPAPKAGGVLLNFYDTFIAPHDIRFEVRHDYYLGNDVFRDAVIHTQVRPGVQVQVAAYLLYQLDERAGGLQVRRMAAHWKLATMTAVAMGMGPRAWLAMTGLFVRMIRIMGWPWVGAYLASLWRGIGRRGPAMLSELAQAIAARDAAKVAALFVVSGVTPGSQVELGPRALAAAELVDALPAGTRLQVVGPVAAGFTTAFRFQLVGGTPAEGLGILEFDPATRKIRRARFFPA